MIFFPRPSNIMKQHCFLLNISFPSIYTRFVNRYARLNKYSSNRIRTFLFVPLLIFSSTTGPRKRLVARAKEESQTSIEARGETEETQGSASWCRFDRPTGRAPSFFVLLSAGLHARTPRDCAALWEGRRAKHNAARVWVRMHATHLAGFLRARGHSTRMRVSN